MKPNEIKEAIGLAADAAKGLAAMGERGVFRRLKDKDEAEVLMHVVSLTVALAILSQPSKDFAHVQDQLISHFTEHALEKKFGKTGNNDDGMLA